VIVRKKKKKEDKEDEGVTKGVKDYEIQKNAGDKILENEELIVSSNLPFPRQHLACENQEFLIETIEGMERSAFTLPFSLQVELTGTQSVQDQKYVKFDFIFDGMQPTLPESEVTFGVKPVKVIATFRKGLHSVNNRSQIKLDYSEFMMIVNKGRELIGMIQNVTHKQVRGSQLDFSRDIVIRETPSTDLNHPSSIVIVRLTFQRRENEATKVSPIIHVREFFEDKKAGIFRPSPRGITIGLRAFYRLVYPITKTMMVMLNSFVRIKREMDEIKDRANIEVSIFKIENDWKPDAEPEDPEENIHAKDYGGSLDDLGRLEKEQRELEKHLSTAFQAPQPENDQDEKGQEDNESIGDEVDFEIE
jgi:hypothetical protein